MAASLFIEEETGTYTARRHRHNGYYAGDFAPSGEEERGVYSSYDERPPW